MPELTELDEPTQTVVRAAVARLRASVDEWTDRFLRLARDLVPGYDQLDDDDIKSSARSFVDGEIAELESFRIPDDALRTRLEAFALRRLAQGISTETLSLSYHLGSREMLALMDEIALEVGMPNELLLAIHDSTWEFASEATAVFARVQHGILLDRARFDAERRSAFTRNLLLGTANVDQIRKDAEVFGLDPRQRYTALAAQASASVPTSELRRIIADATHTSVDRLLFAEVGVTLGCISPVPADGITKALVGVARPRHLEEIHAGFHEANQALETAERFGLSGTVRLADLGPKPLVLASATAGELLREKHFDRINADTRTGPELSQTMRTYLECNQDTADTAHKLLVHPNTVRYRVNRFRELTGLDVRHTEELVTAWWLLNRE